MDGRGSDQALADSVKAAGNVIMLADATYESTVDAIRCNQPANWRAIPYRLGPAIEERPIVLPPFQALTDAAAASATTSWPLDRMAPARRMPPFIRSGDEYLPSLGVAAALMAGGIAPEEVTLAGDAHPDSRPRDPARAGHSARRYRPHRRTSS